MKHDYALCRIENLFVGAVLVDELLGVRGLERKERCPICFLILYGQFYKVLNFPVFCSSHLLFFCVLLSTQLKLEVLLQHHAVLGAYQKMFL